MAKVFISIYFIWVFAWVAAEGQIVSDTTVLAQLLAANPAKFGHIIQNSAEYEVQIIYTQIDRDAENKPKLRHFTYRANKKSYFNPASLVKLPTSALALEKLDQMLIPGVNRYARMGTDSSFACQNRVVANKLNDPEYPCVARYIEQMLLLSDNDAYSRMYEFLGQAYIQKQLQEKGYDLSRIVRRFDACDTLENKHTNAIIFYNDKGEQTYKQAAQSNLASYDPPLGEIKKGSAYINDDWQLIREPKDFTYGNFIPLEDIHQMLISVMMPEAVGEKQSFELYDVDYTLLRRGLGAYPREGAWTHYARAEYYDTYKKYLYYGRKNQIVRPDLRIFNIVGWWDGYLSDCAYFVDFSQGIEFFLSAVIYVNHNQMFDYRFEYNTIGFPFLAHLGQLIYALEEKREKLQTPDLSRYDLYKQD